MSDTRRRQRGPLRSTLLLACVLGAAARSAESTEPNPNDPKYDCGTIALHAMLAIQGRPAHIEAVRNALPALHPLGHSLADLKSAARSFGLTLKGVSLPRGERAPERAALVLMQIDGHGHFVVVRPVGWSGRMAQVIDPADAPTVLDAVELYASPQWTGLGLVPAKPGLALPLSMALIAIGLAAPLLLVIVIVRGRRRARTDGVAKGTC